MLESFYQTGTIEAGCDEAGRGCLAGPVVAAAVIFSQDYVDVDLDDSKKLSQKKRAFLAEKIKSEALAWAIGACSPAEIDKINILQASFLAMHRAIDKLDIRPNHLIIDGNRFKEYERLKHTCIIKGDGKYLSIAAASILAKTFRDDQMKSLAEEYPEYGWQNNMGYPTKRHRMAIMKYGATVHHRKTFQSVHGYPIKFPKM